MTQLFGHNRTQDERLDALESHVRRVSELAESNSLALSELKVRLYQIDKALGDRIASDDVDPLFAKMNGALGQAREQAAQLRATSDETWNDELGKVRDTLGQVDAALAEAEAGTDA